jgi:hypothetical protein
MHGQSPLPQVPANPGNGLPRFESFGGQGVAPHRTTGGARRAIASRGRHQSPFHQECNAHARCTSRTECLSARCAVTPRLYSSGIAEMLLQSHGSPSLTCAASSVHSRGNRERQRGVRKEEA